MSASLSAEGLSRDRTLQPTSSQLWDCFLEKDYRQERMEVLLTFGLKVRTLGGSLSLGRNSGSHIANGGYVFIWL